MFSFQDWEVRNRQASGKESWVACYLVLWMQTAADPLHKDEFHLDFAKCMDSRESRLSSDNALLTGLG